MYTNIGCYHNSCFPSFNPRLWTNFSLSKATITVILSPHTFYIYIYTYTFLYIYLFVLVRVVIYANIGCYNNRCYFLHLQPPVMDQLFIIKSHNNSNTLTTYILYTYIHIHFYTYIYLCLYELSCIQILVVTTTVVTFFQLQSPVVN